jgi:hypothetical protein
VLPQSLPPERTGDVESYEVQLERAAGRLTRWVQEQATARWPDAAVVTEPATANGTWRWRIERAGTTLRLGITEPALTGQVLEESLVWLEASDWLALLETLRPDGLLIAAGCRFFAWDADKDRGVRLLDIGS